MKIPAESTTFAKISSRLVLHCSDERIYSAILDRYFWWGGNNGKEGNPLGSKPVGRKRPNPWGLYDISGNLWEWCSDWFTPPYDRGPQVDPKGPSAGTHRIMRGGGWESYALHLRSADRCPTQPNDLRNGRLIGLRIAADDTTKFDRSRRQLHTCDVLSPKAAVPYPIPFWNDQSRRSSREQARAATTTRNPLIAALCRIRLD